MRLKSLLAAIAAGLLFTLPARAIDHPFLLWTKPEAEALRKRIETDPVAKQQYERMAPWSATGKGKSSHPTLLNLFNYLVMGDEAAGEKEKKELLKFIGKVPEPLTDEFKAKIQQLVAEAGGDYDKIWQRGNASFADSHMRDEQTLNTLRYDVLYDKLTPEEREGVEKAMRSYIQFHLDGHKPWHPDFHYGKQSWLPNMSWPRAIGTYLMAVALKDEKSIEALFNSEGGWKWFFDSYVSDGRFYNEEFAKYYSNIGTMLTYCEGLERLGLGKYGYGYTGKGGANMKSLLEMYFWIGYPRTDMPGGMPNYRRVAMGDARSADGILEPYHSIVEGYRPDGTGGDRWFQDSRMNGPLPKFLAPLWYECGARRFPDAGFDYFLAQMRKPGETVYLPSLVYGLGPIDPAKVKPPTVKSYLAYERQFAFLRADESPAYWEGAAPAVALQFGGYYAHYAHDCFSLLGYQAFNRPIYMNPMPEKSSGPVTHYVNEQIKSGPPSGYIARHPWADTVRGHAGVVVDYLQARPVESGEEGLKHHRLRQDFAGAAKFVAGRAKGIYPDVDQERALLLTREYLFDLFWLSSDRPRIYDWNVHGPGWAALGKEWAATSELNGSMLYREPGAKQPEGYEDKVDANDLRNVRKLQPGGDAWQHVVLQSDGLADVTKGLLTKEWFDRGIGVRVSMLGAPGTTVFSGLYPMFSPEWGGTTLVVRRETPATTFIALHEPFENGKPPATRFERIAETPIAVAARVVSKTLDDRILLAFGDGAGTPQTLSGDGETFTFTDYGFVRVRADTVTVEGQVSSLKVKVAGSPKLVVNGKEVSGKVEAGFMSYEKKATP
jgi:hypothetical protein